MEEESIHTHDPGEQIVPKPVKRQRHTCRGGSREWGGWEIPTCQPPDKDSLRHSTQAARPHVDPAIYDRQERVLCLRELHDVGRGTGNSVR